MQTLHGIEVNLKLVWDNEIKPEEIQTEEFFVWYLSRVLNNGNWEDIRRIPREVIRSYLGRLNLSRQVEQFWNWYLNTPKTSQS